MIYGLEENFFQIYLPEQQFYLLSRSGMNLYWSLAIANHYKVYLKTLYCLFNHDCWENKGVVLQDPFE